MAIYLRLITERWSLESRLIRFGTRWWPSHIEFVRTDKAIGEYGPYDVRAIDTLGSRLGDGVRIRPYNYCQPSREEWWTADNIDAAYNWAYQDIGCKYDWVDIIGFAAGRDWHRKGRYICSELVDWSFKQAGNPLTNIYIPSHRVSPRDILVSPLVKLIRRVI